MINSLLRSNLLEPILAMLIFIIGMNVTTIIWNWKNKVIPMWLLFMTIGSVHPTFIKRYFIQGPGFILVPVWLILSALCSWWLAPELRLLFAKL